MEVQPRGGGYGPMMNRGYFVENGHSHADHPLWWLLMFLFLALLIALIVWVVLRLIDGRNRAAQTPATQTSAVSPQFVAAPAGSAVLDVVRMRYAKGEIDRDEFLRMNGDLGGPAPPSWPQAEAPTETPPPAPAA